MGVTSEGSVTILQRAWALIGFIAVVVFFFGVTGGIITFIAHL